jgi:C1A family cysteine protease
MKKLILLLFIFSFTIINAQGYGYQFDQEKYEAVQQSVPIVTRSYSKLPNSYSLKGYTPTPKSQFSQGSCVGWATAYGARTITNAIRNGWNYNRAKIDQNTFSPSFIYNQIRLTDDCRGAFIYKALEVMANNGAAKLKDFPYDYKSCLKSPSSFTFSKANNHKIISYERLDKYRYPYNSTIISKIKKAIANKNPVLMGLHKFTSLNYDKDFVWVPNSGSSGHAMVIVGYDNNKAGGAFEVMNSHGYNFGNKGFFWIKYADFLKQASSLYLMIDKREIPNNNYNNNNNNYALNKVGGELTLKLANGSDMSVSLASGASRNFNIVKASKTTYKVDRAYSSGTQFRIYLKNKQRGYVYLIGYGSADKSVNKLYPFASYTDYFNYTNSEIALPNEDYFIEFDNKPGRDILCVLYSKTKLDINTIISKAKFGNGDFVSRVKGAIQNKMFKGSDVKFSNNKIAFNATSKSSTAKVVPIFIEMNHQ